MIVGGTTFMGARGDYTHTVVGALILTVLTTILVGKGYDQADQQIIFGVLILLVVAGYGRDATGCGIASACSTPTNRAHARTTQWTHHVTGQTRSFVAAASRALRTVGSRVRRTGSSRKTSHKVNMLGKGGQTGVNLKSTYKGKPFGTCKMTGKLVIPNTQPDLEVQGRHVQARRPRHDRRRQRRQGHLEDHQGLRHRQVQGHHRQGHVQRQALDRHLPLQGQRPY